jgi:hypothetical protein
MVEKMKMAEEEVTSVQLQNEFHGRGVSCNHDWSLVAARESMELHL